MKRCFFALLGILSFVVVGTAAAGPTITASAPISITAGNPTTSYIVATVSDTSQSAGSLTVTATSVPNGIAFDVTTNNAGTISAQITVACWATAGANDIGLQVKDNLGATANATLVINVSFESAPSKPTITATTNGTGTTDEACPAEPLTLTASSTNATSYQWFNDSGAIDNASSATYTVTAAGTYSVMAINACYTTFSNGYVVSNPTPHTPTVTASGATEFCGSGSVTLSSDSATGIQWYKNGVAISGANAQSYTATTAGSYTCTLDALGCISSASTAVVVTFDSMPSTPTITGETNGTETQDQACPEQPLTLDASVTGATSYQWYSDNAPISGATTTQLVVTAAGNYSIVAYNGVCSVQSATYTVQNPTPHAPFISFRNQDSSLTSLEVCATSQIIDSDSATGIQWYKDGVAIAGANSQSYVATASGTYTAQLDALGCHSQFGRNVTLTLDAAPSTPTITGETNGTGAQDQACPEQPLTLDASSTGATSYQWYQNNDTLNGSTSSQLVVTSAGTYYVTAFDGLCSVTSAGYVVQDPAPHSPFISFRNQDSSVTSLEICNTSQIIDSDSATGIQWYKDGVAIPGANSQSYTATASGTYTAQLDALGCHSQFGRNVTLVIDSTPSTPTITGETNGTGTQDQACPEQPLTLDASVTGATSYQWYSDNAPISGATTTQLVVTATGNYSIVAYNGVCSVQSATYVVQNPTPHAPFISFRNQDSSLTSLEICATSQIIDSDSATGIQWYFNGVAIPGANSQSYVATQSGTYTAQLDALGCHSQFGRNVTLTLDAAPSTPTITGETNGTGAQDQACPEVPLTLDASSTGATSYQWYQNNDTLNGETSSQLVITSAATYYVVAYNGLCSTKSAGYVVQDPAPHAPFISFRNQDSSVTSLEICNTSQIIDSDSATGIQWYKDGVAIPGANSQSYTATASGTYTAQLDALGCHSQIGRNVTLVVDSMPSTPTITGETNGTGTQDQACPEQPLTLDASVTGATSYQWYSDNAPISGATTTQLVVTAFGNYSIVAYNGVCSVQSATYTVQNPTPHSPFISFRNQDSSLTSLQICATSQIIDSDSATGIQWYFNGVAIPGANSQSYTATQSGTYTAQLDALGCHSQFGRDVTLTLEPIPATPTISATENGTGTTDQACPEQPLTLTATSADATSYQWYLNGTAISGATSATYSATGAGSYTVQGSNGFCTSTSSAYTVQNPTPNHPAFLTANGPTTFCQGGSVTLWSDSATGIQWYLNGVAIPGANNESYVATASGSYTAILDALGCHSATSSPIVVTVNPVPATPTISAATNGTGTTDQACPEEPLTLTATSADATSFQWYADGGPISGATSATLTVTGVGDYTVIVSNGYCSATSSAYTVRNPTPHKPTVTASGATTFCAGGSVTLTSDSATGIQWYLNGVAISGAGNQSYVATVSGSYTAILDALGCHSTASDPIVVTVNANPDATITAPTIVASGTTGNSASVASAGVGATYAWTISGGTITSGNGTNAITFTAGAIGTLSLQATVTTSAGCSDTKSASVTVAEPVVVSTIRPPTGTTAGGTQIIIEGSGFVSGATVTLGGTAATGVVVVSATKITATAPAHAAGAADVVVTDPNTISGTLASGYTYRTAHK